jgi:hypothetical protein
MAAVDDSTRPIFQNWALATVNVAGLNVRSAPGLHAPLIRDGYRLNIGDHVLVLSDARSADGMWWLTVAMQRPGPLNPVRVGWAAAGTRQDPWIEEDNGWCRSAPSFEGLLALSGVERMGCYGRAPITIEAYQATLPPDAGLGGACDTIEPTWLLCDHINYSWVNRAGGSDWEFLLHFNPATGIPETDLAPDGTRRLLHITGHFDDEAATDCASETLTELDEYEAGLGCAVLFVVDQLELVSG